MFQRQRETRVKVFTPRVSEKMSDKIYEIASSVRGYHVYRTNWLPFIGECLSTALEYNNPADKFAVAVCKGDVIVGHVPREMSKVVHFFVKHGGSANIIITDGHYKHSSVAGGLEIECFFRFTGSPALITKLKSLL